MPNRAFAADELDQFIVHVQRADASFALHYIDLDKFKQITDEFGHDAGDAVLRDAARRFTACTRSTDMVARLGGDEFLILQPAVGSGDGQDAESLLKRADEAMYRERDQR